MTDKKITQLNNITGASLASGDEFVVVDISADETKAITRDQLFQSVPNILTAGNMTGTAVTQSSTDLTGGRLMKVGDYGAGIPIAYTDFNLIPMGVRFFAGSTALNRPDSITNWSGVTFRGFNANNGYMLAFGGDRVYQRGFSGAVWKPWHQIYNSGTIVGTASFAGGINTGAAFEYFTGPNGQTYRYADGRQVCTNNNAAITTAPAAFVGTITKLDSDKMWTGRWRT